MAPRWTTWLLIAAQIPPLLYTAAMVRDFVGNYDCRASTAAPDCDPLMAWGAGFGLLVYLPAIWLVCNAVPFAIRQATKPRPCPYCGNANARKATRCSHCGGPTSTPLVAAPYPSPADVGRWFRPR